MRTEKEILADLEKLCQSPGYIHTLAFFCFRDNTTAFGDEITPKDLEHINPFERLIRTEISTLIGMMVKSTIDVSIPSPDTIQKQIQDTEHLLKELHDGMTASLFDVIKQEGSDHKSNNSFSSAKTLREPIFYGAESAYSFQYRDFCPQRYQKDSEWLKTNKGFTMDEAVTVVNAISTLQNEKLLTTLIKLQEKHPDHWTMLPAFSFTLKELEAKIPFPLETIKAIISGFSIPQTPCNEKFRELWDFNLTNACPIIPIEEDKFILLQSYSLLESAYESPIHWMRENDKSYYYSIGQGNRGAFTESFSAQQLEKVFGKERVFRNVRFSDNSEEVDILVVYADRAIILQAKSKTLTLAARKGNDNALQKDFKDGIQRAYDQGWKCANHLLDKHCSLIDDKGNTLNIRRNFTEVFIFCVVADHYPALSFQANNLLKYEEHEVIRPPYVMDIFFLDVMVEFLNNPLYFLSFVNRRTKYFDNISSSHEITNLAYHLKRNLWLGEYIMMSLGDDISQELDIAIRARREGLPGNPIPEGILTKFRDTPFGEWINYINEVEYDGVLDLGFFLLELNDKAVSEINYGIDLITIMSSKDKAGHDFSIAAGDGGLTVHCNYSPPDIMLRDLQHYCKKRKYIQKANKWFGIGIHTLSDKPFDLVTGSTAPWKQSDSMDNAMKGFRKLNAPQHASLKEAFKKPKKVGRNDPCPCGSGGKYKKCCFKG